MNDLQTFTYNNSQVRTVEKNGEPWFVLKDVCDILGLGTPARVAERLDEDEVSLTHLTDSIGRKQEMTVISESGLYNVILRSDKPEAKPFRKWVTAEVLPAIRKTGVYSTPKAEKPSKTPAPEQLTLETSEYHYFPKTFNGEPVITVADFVHFTGVSTNSVYKALPKNCITGTDYLLLEYRELVKFKATNRIPSKRTGGALIVIKKSGVEKLLGYYDCMVEIPMIEEKKQPVTKTNSTDPNECVIALGVLGAIREKLKKAENTEAVAAFNIAIRQTAWEMSKRCIQ